MRRNHGRPPKEVDIELPSGTGSVFLEQLLHHLLNTDDSFKTRYLGENILSKYCDPRTTSPADRRVGAIDKWLNTERRNARTNMRLMLLEPDFGWTKYTHLLQRIRFLIRRVLGPLPYDTIFSSGVHTNGASTRVKRHPNAALLKLVGEGELSPSALKHWLVAASNTRLSKQDLRFQESSTLFTVPKKSEIDRVACKEPEINMLLQRCVGKYIQQRLRTVAKINLRDQTINQRLAQNAVSDGLATIDLSSASDSISKQLVLALLPFDWWSLMDDLRVKSTVVSYDPNGKDGTDHQLEMFSSMGNGFTFELESLIFWAITRAVCEMSKVRGRISVYGDDIVAPNAIVPRLIRVFAWFGFKTNPDKTFWKGDFRESCGKHYYRGFDVSPLFVRRPVATLPDLINILNQVLEWSGRGLGFIPDPMIAHFHRHWSSYVPSYLWGGCDTSDNSRLVTADAPRYRMIPKLKKLSHDEAAGLTHWFMVKGADIESSIDDMYVPGGDLDSDFEVDPTLIVSYKAKRCSRGWTSCWSPWLILES